jgi:magnesium-transporting ATPase (P-type)
MVFFGITNAFNFRSFRKSSLTRSPFSNKPLILVSAFILLTTLLIVYLPFSNHIFETVPVKPVFLLFGALISLSIVFIFDILKYWNEKKHFWTEDMQHFETSKLRNLPEKSGKREINLPLSPVKTFQQQ